MILKLMLNKMDNKCVVSGTLGFVIRMSQIFGVASLKMENVRNGWHIRASRVASLYGMIAIVLMCLLTTITITWDILLDTISSYQFFKPINAVMLIAMASVISLALVTQAFTGMYRMQSILISLVQVRKINAELNLYGSPKSNETMERIWTIWSLLGGLILVIVDYGIFIIHVFTYGNIYIAGMYLSHHIKYVMLKILTIQISLLFTTVLSSFNHLNDCLNNLLQEMARKYTHKIGNIQYPDGIVVQRLGCLYCCLCGVIRKLDKSHGIVLVPIVGSLLLHFIVTPHNFITKLFGNTRDFYAAVIQVVWAVYHSSDLIMIVEPCHRTQIQMDRTKQLISRILRVTPPEHFKLIAELELFYKHTMTNEAVYAPINLFYLNRALLLTIIGSVTTYLVVVVKL